MTWCRACAADPCRFLHAPVAKPSPGRRRRPVLPPWPAGEERDEYAPSPDVLDRL